jgi:heat-inducible transcriptional repressor
MTTDNPQVPGGAEDTLLTPRQRVILRNLVEEYVDTAAPIGSHTLRQMGDLTVSSATIRSELGLLENLGYLAQPHTSAGRIPTVKGYRYFVEQLLGDVELPLPSQRMIRHQFHQIRLNLDQWMQLTAAVLAHTTRAAALVTAPHAASARFRHIELISIHDTVCLMILVLQDGSIHQEMLVMATAIGQEALSLASNQLNALLHDRTAVEIEESAEPEIRLLDGWRAQVLQQALDVMGQVDARSISAIHRDGLANVLREPEFVAADRSRQMMEMLERSQVLETILAKTLNSSGVQIIFGGEGPYEDISDVSLVLSPYGIRGRASGVLGVFGPMRMPYGRAISAVQYVADLLNGLVEDIYGA